MENETTTQVFRHVQFLQKKNPPQASRCHSNTFILKKKSLSGFSEVNLQKLRKQKMKGAKGSRQLTEAGRGGAEHQPEGLWALCVGQMPANLEGVWEDPDQRISQGCTPGMSVVNNHKAPSEMPQWFCYPMKRINT